MSKFWSFFVKDLVFYVLGEQLKLLWLVKLNINENFYGLLLQVFVVMQVEFNDDLCLYFDFNGEWLKQVVVVYYGVQVNQVFVGNGFDEVFVYIFYGFF